MNLPKWVPTGPEIFREALIVLAGAAIAALVVKSLPGSARAWFSLPGSTPPQ